MKGILGLVMLLLFVRASAQSDKKKPVIIVQTSEGEILPEAVWKSLNKSDFKFQRHRNSNEDTLLLRVVRRTEQEKEEYLAKKENKLKAMAKPEESKVFKSGDKVRFDKMKDIEGNKFDFRSDTSTVVVLNFWFINCPPCRSEIPHLNEMMRKYKDNPNVKFIAIALDEEYDLKKFLRLNPFNYHIIPSGRFYTQKYGVHLFPTNVVVGKDKKVKFSTVGLPSNTMYWLEKTIDEALLSVD